MINIILDLYFMFDQNHKITVVKNVPNGEIKMG